MVSTEFSQYIDKYKSWGFCLLPIQYKSKKPQVKWQLYQKRKPSDNELQSWFHGNHANVAIVCGAISRNLVVLDCDNEELYLGLSDFFYEKFGRKIDELTPIVKTGGGGYHIYLIVRQLPQLFHPVGEDRKHIPDIQSEGGYVLAPPSIHPSGNPYRLLNPQITKIFTIESLSELAIDIPTTREAMRGSGAQNEPGWVTKALQGVGEGERDNTCIKLAGYFRNRQPEDVTTSILLDFAAKCNPPLDEATVRKCVKSAYSYPDSDTQARSLEKYPAAVLNDVLLACQRYLFMPDTGALEVLLGAAAANHLPGDPVWLLLVGPPGYGKTELLNSLTKAPDIYHVAVLTEASLLSGTPRREAQGSKGGLLRQIGEFGILLVKDFGGILSLTRESRGPILAALREVYDGAWTRYVGSDGGRMLTWQGKAGLIGGATPSIDQHYAVMAALGERFSYFRLEEGEEANKAQAALIQAGHEAEVRSEMAKLVAGLLTNIDFSAQQPEISIAERDKLVALATFTTRCRSIVERDTSQTKEIQLIPGVESPTRLVKVLAQLLRGLQIVGVTKERAWELVTKVALDSMPALRQRIILAMLRADKEFENTELATILGYPTVTIRRTLEDITCYAIVKRESQGAGKSDIWSLTQWARTTYREANKTLS